MSVVGLLSRFIVSVVYCECSRFIASVVGLL